jgi:glycosyltransferase involved in cell wall biosynthesis
VKGSSAESRRVLFVVPSLRRAGAETQAVDVVNALSHRGFETHLAFFEDRADLLERVDVSGVKVHRLARNHKLDFALAASLARLIETNLVDVVHCTLQISLFYAALALRLTPAAPSLITAVHTTINQSWRDELYDRFLYRRLLRRCDRVIFVCRSQADHWIRKYPDLRDVATVVYNGVDTGGYDEPAAARVRAEARSKFGIAADRRVVACIAGLRPEKGHEHLLAAFAQLKGSPILLLAGDGPERARIERLVTASKLDDRVIVLGEVPDVRPVIAAADLTVLASTAVETFSMAMLESMAMAVPVVASDIGGLSEAISQGETGYLVPPGDAGALASALQLALDDEAARRAMGGRALENVRNKFSRVAMVDATAEVIMQAVAGAAVHPTGRPRS